MKTKMTLAVCAEQMETRRLLSGYTLNVLSTFDLNNLASSQDQLLRDSQGDLFFEAAIGNGNTRSPQGLWELARGSGTPGLVTSFNSAYSNRAGDMVIDPSGNIFGISTSSTASEGIIWEIASGANSITPLATYNKPNNTVDFNTTQLAVDSSGNLYGIIISQSNGDYGTIWELPQGASTITDLATIPASVYDTGDTTSGQDVNGLVMDSHGDLFGTVENYTVSSAQFGSVWELPAGGSAVSVVAAFNGFNGLGPQGPLLVDSSGDIFGEASGGGASYGDTSALNGVGYGSIFEIASGSSTITALASFNGTDGEDPILGLMADASGNLFGVTTYYGSTFDSLLFELPKGASSTTTLLNYNDTTGVQAGTSLAVDSSGDVFDATNTTVFELAPGGSGGGGGGGGGGGSSSLSGALSGKLAASVVEGQKANIAQHLTITDSGSAVSGNVSAALYLASGTSVDSNSVQLTSTTKSVKLKTGKKLSLNFKVPTIATSVAPGTYYLVAQITDPNDNTSDAASLGTIAVAAPVIDLSGVFSTQPVPGKNGKTALSFTVSDAGNIAAAGPLAFNIDTSADGQLSDAAVFTTSSKKISIKPGKSIKIKMTESLPAGSYYVVIQLDPSDAFNDVNLANNVFATQAQITV